MNGKMFIDGRVPLYSERQTPLFERFLYRGGPVLRLIDHSLLGFSVQGKKRVRLMRNFDNR